MNVKTTFDLELDGKTTVMRTPTHADEPYCGGDDCCAMYTRIHTAVKIKFPGAPYKLPEGASDIYRVHLSEDAISSTDSTQASGFSFQFAPAQLEMMRMYVSNDPIEWFVENGWGVYDNTFDIVLEQQFEDKLTGACASTVRKPGRVFSSSFDSDLVSILT